MNLSEHTGKRVEYQPEDENGQIWYTGQIEKDSFGKSFVRDTKNPEITFYPGKNDKIKLL